MSQALTGSEQDALDYLYSGGDETIECRRMVWVLTRYSQKCVSIMHDGSQTVAAGSRMVRETAKVEGQFGSCYTCEACMRAADAELRMR